MAAAPIEQVTAIGDAHRGNSIPGCPVLSTPRRVSQVATTTIGTKAATTPVAATIRIEWRCIQSCNSPPGLRRPRPRRATVVRAEEAGLVIDDGEDVSVRRGDGDGDRNSGESRRLPGRPAIDRAVD